MRTLLCKAANGDWDVTSKAWQSWPLPVGHAACHKEKQQAVIVLRVSPFGFLGWRCPSRVEGENTCLDFGTGADAGANATADADGNGNADADGGAEASANFGAHTRTPMLATWQTPTPRHFQCR